MTVPRARGTIASINSMVHTIELRKIVITWVSVDEFYLKKI